VETLPETGSRQARLELEVAQDVFGRRLGAVAYVERIAHTLANDIVKEFNGQNGPFL
jgi:hypothetical protein